MGANQQNIWQRFSAALLLVLFLSLQCGRTMFYHTHRYGDTLVSHSHPFNTPGQQHSATQLISIAAVNALSLSDDTTQAVEVPVPALFLLTFYSIAAFKLFKGHRHYTLGRAPPVRA